MPHLMHTWASISSCCIFASSTFLRSFLTVRSLAASNFLATFWVKKLLWIMLNFFYIVFQLSWWQSIVCIFSLLSKKSYMPNLNCGIHPFHHLVISVDVSCCSGDQNEIFWGQFVKRLKLFSCLGVYQESFCQIHEIQIVVKLKQKLCSTYITYNSSHTRSRNFEHRT